MHEFGIALTEAFHLLTTFDADLVEIVSLSLKISLGAVTAAALIALPAGALLAVTRFPGRQLVIIALNALMGLPPVVVGLSVYLLLSRAGPLGALGLLYTPQAMLIAQTLLVVPIIAALSRQTIEELQGEYKEQLAMLGMGLLAQSKTLLWDARYMLVTALLAGFGRAVAEVGAVIIVGGNINHITRVMTTTIALETSKGNLALAMGLGIILLMITIVVNALVAAIHTTANRSAYA
jgi:tungstate transport system permease protein